MKDIVEQVRERIAADAAARVERFDNTIVTGFWTPSGRELPVVVGEPILPGKVVLSDAGEAWFELVSEGYAEPVPTPADREKLERLCEAHHVVWDHARRAVSCVTTVDQVPVAARHVIAAAIAIDAWKYFLVSHPTNKVSRGELVDRIATAAPPDIQVERNVTIHGASGYDWSSDALFRRGRREAGLFVVEETFGRFVERAIGWCNDTQRPLIAVASEDKVHRMQDIDLLRKRLVGISRKTHDLEAQVMRAAEVALS